MDVIWIFVAAFISSILTSLFYRYRTDGTLKIDCSNPEKDIYRFDIDEKKFDKLTKQRYITLKIDSNANLSHK